MRLVIIVISSLIVSGLVLLLGSTNDAAIRTSGIFLDVSEVNLAQFDRVYQPRPFIFPDDLGSHPTYQTEWWYYTGNLADQTGERYGFQLTFFRRALTADVLQRHSEWADEQIYFAHFALSDIGSQTFYPHERFSRGGANMAGVTAMPYHVWLDNWRAEEIEPGHIQIYAQEGEIRLDLKIRALKPVVLHGENGFSPKSDEAGNASYYYSFTRSQATGVIQTPHKQAEVRGYVWMDHEWSTSAMGEGIIGWDWFSLQLTNNQELMYYQLRTDTGDIEADTEGTIVYEDGSPQRLSLADVELRVLDTWTSPTTEAEYPVQWHLAVPSQGLDLTITALMKNQEMNTSTVYWEGAVRVEGSHQGYGYVELTGYESSLAGLF